MGIYICTHSYLLLSTSPAFRRCKNRCCFETHSEVPFSGGDGAGRALQGDTLVGLEDVFCVFCVSSTPPKFNRSPLKSYLPNRKVVFQRPFFRGYVKLRGCIHWFFWLVWVGWLVWWQLKIVFLNVKPRKLGKMISILTNIFSNGLVQPPTSWVIDLDGKLIGWLGWVYRQGTSSCALASFSLAQIF